MRRRRGLVVAAVVVAAVGVSIGVHAASAPKATTADAWRSVGKAPLSPRSDAVVVSVDGSLVVYGGQGYLDCHPVGASCPPPGPLRDGAVYDLRSHTWTPMAKAPDATPVGPWAVDGHALLMLTDQAPQRVVTYHVDTNTWEVLPAPPVPLLANDVLAAGDGFAYVADDAVPGSGSLHRVERLDLSTGRWHLLPPSTNRPRMYLRGLFVGPHGLLMAGLNPYQIGAAVQVEALEHGHWRRFTTPGLDAQHYTFAWTGTGLAAAFPSGGGSGQSLDPTTGRWTGLAAQPDAADGSSWWQGTPTSASGPRIIRWGDVFDTHTGRTMRLTQPDGSSPGVSVGLNHIGVYVMDSNSQLWWQRL